MAKTDVFQKKMFDGDIQEVMLMCAQKIKSVSWFKIYDMDIDGGMIVCLAGFHIKSAPSWSPISPDNSYSIRLFFNKISTNKVEATATCYLNNNSIDTLLSLPIRKFLLHKLMKIL